MGFTPAPGFPRFPVNKAKLQMEEILFACDSCGAEYEEDQMNDYDEYDVCDFCFYAIEEIELEN